MSEEIIIDGVNVKDCRRRIGKNSYCRYFKRSCADNNFNCIWKQHERLKEENERLKTCLEMIKNTEGQAHIKGMEMAKKLEKIKEYITDYPNICKIKGNCIDSRMCSTCFLGGGLEVCEYIADIIEGAEDE